MTRFMPGLSQEPAFVRRPHPVGTSRGLRGTGL